jgi:hypothetical protein
VSRLLKNQRYCSKINDNALVIEIEKPIFDPKRDYNEAYAVRQARKPEIQFLNAALKASGACSAPGRGTTLKRLKRPV